jgi:hypothetical protein
MRVLHADDPAWWSPHDLRLLRGTRLAQAVNHYGQGLQQLHRWLLRLGELHGGSSSSSNRGRSDSSGAGGGGKSVLDGWGMTLDAMRWARSAVWSRAFNIRGLPLDCASTSGVSRVGGGGGAQAVVALVPVLDMCDHDPDQRVSWRVIDAQDAGCKQQGGPSAGQSSLLFQFTTLNAVAAVRRIARISN